MTLHVDHHGLAQANYVQHATMDCSGIGYKLPVS